LVYVSDESVRVLSGENEVKEYSFGGKKVGHQFCPNCGTSLWAVSISQDFFPGMRAINVRTLKDIALEIDTLKLKKMDGRSIVELRSGPAA
jgi:hypothetical protein